MLALFPVRPPPAVLTAVVVARKDGPRGRRSARAVRGDGSDDGVEGERALDALDALDAVLRGTPSSSSSSSSSKKTSLSNTYVYTSLSSLVFSSVCRIQFQNFFFFFEI